MTLLNRCYSIAEKYHKGQFDKGGHAYIEHPVFVADKMNTETEKCVALLHDILEDTKLSAADLLAMEIPQEVVDAVVILTHQPNEKYVDYILRIVASKNPIAIKVKLADLEHNMDLSRIPHPTEKDLDRVRNKYKKSYDFLKIFSKNT